MSIENHSPTPSSGQHFVATRWSIVVAAARQSTPDAREALETLCQIYWYPIYTYVRRRSADFHAAQDLTQEFFARLLERNALRAADPDRGRFRSFLLTACKNFLADEWDRAKAQKRGGGRRALALNVESAESRYALQPVDDLSPERLYEKQWALTFLEHVLNRLREEMNSKGKDRQFQALKPFLTSTDESACYETAARELGISGKAAKVAAHRLRRRYREILRAEIAQTVANPSEVDDEIHRLRTMLG